MRPRKLRFDIRQSGRRLLTIYLAVFAVNVLFYGAFVRPKAKSVADLVEASGPGRDRLAKREAQVKEREEYLAALEKATKDLETLRTTVLSTRERRMIAVQLEVARIASQFGIHLTSQKFENKSLEDSAVQRFAIVVPLEGGYAALRKFLRAVEDSDKFLVIEQVALATARDGGSMIQLNITLATYFVDEELLKERPARRRPGRRA